MSDATAERPLVSIVAPVYNESATLPELVRRLVHTCAPLEARYRFEFVLVDDGSSDDTLQVLRALTTSEPSIDLQPITWFATSLMISAFHSSVEPPGPFARHRDKVSVTRSTDSRWLMKRGRFSRFLQKR